MDNNNKTSLCDYKSYSIATMLCVMWVSTLLRPIYQRPICWTHAKMCELISSVLDGKLLPVITSYNYARGEIESEGGRYQRECVDGQHRWSVLYHYRNTKFLDDKKQKLISYRRVEADGTTSHVFYDDKSVDYAAWIARNKGVKVAVLSDTERERFDKYEICFCEINREMSLSERSDYFVKLSSAGVEIKGSDLEKNYTQHSLVLYLRDEGFEENMTNLMTKLSTKKMKKYWLHFLIRLFKMATSGDMVGSFMRKDSEIKTYLQKKTQHDELHITEEQKNEFRRNMDKFFGLINKLPEKVQMTPTHICALFAEINHPEALDDCVYESWIPFLETSDACGDAKKLWEMTTEDATYTQRRREFYLQAEEEFEVIRRLKRPHAPKDTRKTSPVTREEVWSQWNFNGPVGKCFCCKEELHKDKFECAHILSRKNGGYANTDNLRPTCRKCNRTMRTNNMREWMEKKNFTWVDMM